MKRILNYEHFINENDSDNHYSHLFEDLNYSKSDVMSFVQKEMYNKTIELIFGKECVGKNMDQIEQVFIKGREYIKNERGVELFPILSKAFKRTWNKVDSIVNPKSNLLNKFVFDFKFDELKKFQNLNLQKVDTLNVLNDKKNVENLIREGKLKSTLGNQYNNLTDEQKDVINLVNDYMDDKPAMIKKLYLVLKGAFNWNSMRDTDADNFYVGFKQIASKRSDLNQDNIGFYFLALITSNIYTFFVNVIAEEITKSYKAASTTMKKPETNVVRTNVSGGVRRNTGTRRTEIVSSGSEKSGGVDYAKMFGY